MLIGPEFSDVKEERCHCPDPPGFLEDPQRPEF
jgi:hypothetical protein